MENNVDVRLGLIDYKDLEEDGMDSTKNLGWFDNVSDFIASVNNMRATGGGDAPDLPWMHWKKQEEWISGPV